MLELIRDFLHIFMLKLPAYGIVSVARELARLQKLKRRGPVMSKSYCEFMLGRDFVIQQKDCITLVLTWLYYIKSSHWKRDATEVKSLYWENRTSFEWIHHQSLQALRLGIILLSADSIILIPAKWKRLYNAFCDKINSDKSTNSVFMFGSSWMRSEINEVLRLVGWILAGVIHMVRNVTARDSGSFRRSTTSYLTNAWQYRGFYGRGSRVHWSLFLNKLHWYGSSNVLWNKTRVSGYDSQEAG